jgi:hemoglobin/transferrin/lactoferrin receptor protein
MPSWVTFNLRGQYDFSSHFSLQLALENIADRNYRTFASGFSAAGRNLVASFRAYF